MSEARGVGTELGKLIPAWATNAGKGCKCSDFSLRMDRWGVSGCMTRSEVIIKHLMSQDEHLVPILRLLPVMVKKATAGQLLNKAIANEMKRLKAEA